VRKKRKQLKDKGVLKPGQGSWKIGDGGGKGKERTKPKKKPESPVKTKPGSGPQVSEGLNLTKVPKKGSIGPPIRSTVDLVNSVHSDGNLPQIPLKVTSTHGRLGHYMYDGRTGKPIEIGVSRKSDHPKITTSHEIGHFLDGQAWGRPGTPGHGNSDKDKRVVEKYRKLHKTMQDSNAIKLLRNEVPNQTYTVDFGDTKRTYNADRKYASYLLRSDEQFARAYSQYIAVKSGDKDMLGEIDRIRNRKSNIDYHEQWDNDDFEPIKKSFDDLFSELGWIEGA
jgi:hypothetical protein